MHTAVIVAAVAIAVSLGAIAYLRRNTKPRPCVNCGDPSRFGFSKEAESSAADIARLCLNCLKPKLADDYARYEARALVVEPNANFPCYVFQPSSRWRNERLMQVTVQLLSKMEPTCHFCGTKSNFLLVTSHGLSEDKQDQISADGISETLLQSGNPTALFRLRPLLCRSDLYEHRKSKPHISRSVWPSLGRWLCLAHGLLSFQ